MTETFIEIGFTQHCGKRSPAQQDALWNGEFCVQAQYTNTSKRFRDGTETVLLAVADGVAVSTMPHLASQFVADAIGALEPSADLTAQTIRNIHGQLCDRYGRGPNKDTATTVVAARLHGNTCQVVNVSDSRAYLIAGDGTWTQLSHDHIHLNELKADGHLAETESDESESMYDQLMDCLIANPEEDNFRIHSIQVPFKPGDSLLLCSDGLHDVLQEAMLKNLYRPSFPPSDQVGVWLQAVLAAGAPDNVSIILAKFKPRGHRHSDYAEYTEQP